MTQYMASTHPQHGNTTTPADYLTRAVGAHRKPTRWTAVWDRLKGWR